MMAWQRNVAARCRRRQRAMRHLSEKLLIFDGTKVNDLAHLLYANDKECASCSSSKWEMFPLTNYMTKIFFRSKKGDDDDELEERLDSTPEKCKNCILRKHNIISISLCASQTLLSANFVAATSKVCFVTLRRALIISGRRRGSKVQKFSFCAFKNLCRRHL